MNRDEHRQRRSKGNWNAILGVACGVLSIGAVWLGFWIGFHVTLPEWAQLPFWLTYLGAGMGIYVLAGWLLIEEPIKRKMTPEHGERRNDSI